MDNIKLSKGKLYISVSVYVYQEGDAYVSYCPSLDLAGSGESEAQARASFRVVLDEYIAYCVKNNTLHDDLTNHGWLKGGASSSSPSLSDLLENNSLRDIMETKEYSRYHEAVQVGNYAFV